MLPVCRLCLRRELWNRDDPLRFRDVDARPALFLHVLNGIVKGGAGNELSDPHLCGAVRLVDEQEGVLSRIQLCRSLECALLAVEPDGDVGGNDSGAVGRDGRDGRGPWCPWWIRRCRNRMQPPQ